MIFKFFWLTHPFKKIQFDQKIEWFNFGLMNYSGQEQQCIPTQLETSENKYTWRQKLLPLT